MTAPRAAPASGEVRALTWTIFAFIAAMALHVDRLPVWCTLAVLALAGWRLLVALGRLRMVPGPIRLALGAALLLAVIAQFSTISGLSAGTALLACMGALKLTETDNRRDHYIVTGVSLFLVVAACLDRQGLPRIPLYVGVVWLQCAALAIAGSPAAEVGAREAWRLAGRTLLLALPIALVSFLLFPRVQGQIWALPGSGAAVTGLSNEMSPGAISELSESYEPAFRVRFLDATPPAQALYWRGPVLHNFDGYTWRRDARSFQLPPKIGKPSQPYRHRVMLEPHQRNWWFALDLPSASPSPKVYLNSDFQLLSAEPVTQPISYEVVSFARPDFTGPLPPSSRRQSLQLPAGRNLRSLEFARRMRASSGDDAAFVRAALAHFGSGAFSYTLTPPRLDLNSVDDFLFNTRAGFCGHFASAFVTLMRAGGLPSRVVTGYQGGEWNPIGSYYLVRQADAHAWAEVWMDGRGWVRIDPTGVVAPERLSRGSFATLPDAVSRTNRMLREIGWLAEARFAWDSLNTWWKDGVLDFDLRAQMALLSRLGVNEPRVAMLGWLLAGALLVWLAWITLRFSREAAANRGDTLSRAYRRLCRRLAGAGLARLPHEGPLDYSRRIAVARPDLAERVVPLLSAYAQLRFGARQDERLFKAFIDGSRGITLE